MRTAASPCNRVVRLAYLLASVWALAASPRAAQAQSEDCADASLSPLSVGVVGTGNFTNSFNDGPSGCGSTSNRTQWWTFTPAESGRYMISTCGSDQIDTHLGISLSNQPCVGVATYLACNDDACGAAAQIVLNLIGGNQYRIRVAAFGAVTNGGGYTILVLRESSVPPDNDDCSSATPVTLGSTSGTTLGASGSLNLNTCGGTADVNDVYFVFTAPNTRRYRISVCSAQFDAVVSVHSACPVAALQTFQIGSACATSQNAPVIGCANRGASTNVGLNGGQQAFVRVAGAADQSGTGSPFVGFGAFTLNIEEIPFPKPANDDCAQSLDLNAQTLPFEHEVEARGAFNDIDPGSCNSSAANEGYFGVWYRFTAPQTGILVISEQSPTDVAIGIWEGSDCMLLGESIRCSDPETVLERVAGGQTYLIQIGTFDPSGPVSTYRTRFNFLPAPPNDTCQTATDISDESFPFAFEVNALDASSNLPDPTCNAGPTANASVYWRFNAPDSGGRLTLRETGTDNDVVWAVYTGDCDMPMQVACFTADTNDNNFIDVTPGTSYLIQLSRQPTTAAIGRYVGTIEFETPPNNDECIDAELVTGDFVFRNSLATDTTVPGQAVCVGEPADFFKDTWYRFVAPDDGALNVLALSGPTARMALYRSPTCLNINAGFVGCGQGPNSISIPDLSAGETVYIRVGMAVSAPVFNGQVLVTFVPMRGACCVSESVCVVTTESQCDALGGTFNGHGTLCFEPDDDAPVVFTGGQSGPIPDNDPQGVAFALNVSAPASELVGSVRLNASLQHTFVGDLVMSLEKDGRSVVLTNRTRRGQGSAFGSSADLSGNYTLSDEAATSWWPAATSILIAPGAYHASDRGDLRTSLTEAFNGLPVAGTWVLSVSDNVGSDTGSVLAWGLTVLPAQGNSICGGGPEPCPGDYNGDGVVDLGDLLSFLGDWNPNLGQTAPGLPGDVSGDGTVDLADLLFFLNDWNPNLGQTCP
ncbi:MAG: proprotein convertase P-domain-containing protein [Phycisphaeraceae bacterium]|nr:proprotein convertase P-domain-containing protein [Phycisphaeraceae bacterium]